MSESWEDHERWMRLSYEHLVQSVIDGKAAPGPDLLSQGERVRIFDDPSDEPDFCGRHREVTPDIDWYLLLFEASKRLQEKEFCGLLATVRGLMDDFDPATAKPITPDMATVLLALRDSPTIMNQKAIESATRISKRTIQKIMLRLEARKLVIRPDGPRSGYMLTPEGERIVETVKAGS